MVDSGAAVDLGGYDYDNDNDNETGGDGKREQPLVREKSSHLEGVKDISLWVLLGCFCVKRVGRGLLDPEVQGWNNRAVVDLNRCQWSVSLS